MGENKQLSDNEFQYWVETIISNLNDANMSVNGMSSILVKMKESSIGAETAYKILESVRDFYQKESDESREDIVLDLMDIIVGYCRPENKIW